MLEARELRQAALVDVVDPVGFVHDELEQAVLQLGWQALAGGGEDDQRIQNVAGGIAPAGDARQPLVAGQLGFAVIAAADKSAFHHRGPISPQGLERGVVVVDQGQHRRRDRADVVREDQRVVVLLRRVGPRRVPLEVSLDEPRRLLQDGAVAVQPEGERALDSELAGRKRAFHGGVLGVEASPGAVGLLRRGKLLHPAAREQLPFSFHASRVVRRAAQHVAQEDQARREVGIQVEELLGQAANLCLAERDPVHVSFLPPEQLGMVKPGPGR